MILKSHPQNYRLIPMRRSRGSVTHYLTKRLSRLITKNNIFRLWLNRNLKIILFKKFKSLLYKEIHRNQTKPKTQDFHLISPNNLFNKKSNNKTTKWIISTVCFLRRTSRERTFFRRKILRPVRTRKKRIR